MAPSLAIQFESLLRKHRVEKVDLVQIDTEGYDYAVIKMIDLKKWKPAIINYEHRHLSREEREMCWRYLVDAGYSLYVHGADTAACLP